MNKLYLWGIIITVLMLVFTWMSVAGSEGGLNGDIVNILTIAAAVVLVVVTVFVVIKYVRQMQTDKADGKLINQTWDGIGEYANELPFGWAVSFLVTIVWGMWYFTMGYPLNSYSQIGEYNEDTAAHNIKFEKEFNDKMQNFSKEEKLEYMINMGESVFLAECKICHGLTADGIDGKAADLNVRIEANVVKHAIVHGANNLKTAYPGGMPAGMASGADVDALSEYIAGGFKGTQPASWASCSGCHGANGEGIAYVGPKLNGFDIDLVTAVLVDGKKGAIGKMPAFDRLNTKQKEAVGAYINSLSK